tara:strand:- start:163 stop:414 length:252 start_codon:yes stop_codon:yes gene_type:complete
MNLTSKAAIKKLNERLLTQNVIMQTLIDVILENGMITEKELESKIQENIEDMETVLDTLQQESSNIEDDVVTSGLYFGPHGEA